MPPETSEKSNGAATNGTALKPRSKRRGLREDAANGGATQTVIATAEAPAPPIDPVVETPPEPAPVAPTVHVAPAVVGPAWFRRIDQPSMKRGDPAKGWTTCATGLLYSAEANQWAQLDALCIDIRVWPGLGEVLICRSKEQVIVRQNDGELYRVPVGKSFAVLPVGTLLHVLTKMEEDSNCVVEIRAWPTIERRLEDGRWVLDYELDMRVVDGLDRKTAWRG
jgi:hypothetical protein